MPFAAIQMDLEMILLCEVSQTEKDKYYILTHMYGIQKDGTDDSVCRPAMEMQTENRFGDTVPEGEVRTNRDSITET